METEVKAPDVSQGAPKLDELEVTPLHRLLRRIVSLRKTVTPNNLYDTVKAEADRLEAERAEAERLKEKMEREKAEREKAVREQKEKEKKEKDAKEGKKEEQKEKPPNEEKEEKKAPTPPSKPKVTFGVDLECFVSLLGAVLLIDRKEFDKAAAVISDLQNRIAHQPINKRHDLNDLQAQSLFYLSRIAELTDTMEERRPFFLDAYRTACLRRDEIGQATLINILLRSWIMPSQIRDATLFHEHAQFPASTTPSQQARHFYYVGLLHALQTSYAEAAAELQQALNKAPAAALGFRLAAHKLLCLVELLMGEIPQRSIFRQKGRAALKPYFELARAVREGRLASFRRVMDDYESAFVRDRTIMLVTRLRHNVLNTGLRRLCVAYSSISLGDVAKKLHLDTPDDAEAVVSKAIRDGVVQARIDHADGFVVSVESADTYQTFQPNAALHKRIAQCIETRSELLKSLRYLTARDKEEEDEMARREREELEREMARIEDDTGEGDGEFGDGDDLL